MGAAAAAAAGAFFEHVHQGEDLSPKLNELPFENLLTGGRFIARLG